MQSNLYANSDVNECRNFKMTEGAINILVADDSGSVRLFIDRALKSSGRNANVVKAAHGLDAMEELSRRAYDIAFLDIQMPDLTGVEVMEKVSETKAKTFCISMSNALQPEHEAQLRQFGAYDFLPKPFSEARLHQVLRTWDTFKAVHDVLVVDDSATVRRIVVKVLRRSIFSLDITEAGDGKSALAALSEKSFRIIFSDFNMPGMTGIELANEIVKRKDNTDVVLMSTEYTSDLDYAAHRVGARAFLRKPFYPEDVDGIIHHVFALPHPRFSKQVRMFATN